MKTTRGLFLLALLTVFTDGCRRKTADTDVTSADAVASASASAEPSEPPPATPSGDVIIPRHGRFSPAAPGDEPGVVNNPYDTTDDMTEPNAPPPTKQKLLGGDVAAIDSKTGAAKSDNMSETVGTSFKLTYYHISLRPSGDANEVKLYDCKGNFLTWASRAWRADAIMEGTARYRDASGESKSINIADGAGSCWIPLDWESRWGLGVWNPSTGNSYQLRPFRSIAIDRRELVMGAWYYIRELDGVQMPYPVSTMKHDGCVRAMDVGTAVLGKHIDFYVAYASAYQKLIGTPGTPMYHRYYVSVFSGATRCKRHIERGY